MGWMGRLLCSVGVHRWEYETNYEQRGRGQRERWQIVSYRCARRCDRYDVWMIAGAERLRELPPLNSHGDDR